MIRWTTKDPFIRLACQLAVRSVSSLHNGLRSFCVSCDVLAILSMDDENAVPIVTINHHLHLDQRNAKGLPAWQRPEISDPTSPVDGPQRNVQEECRPPCYISFFSREAEQALAQSHRVQVRVCGVASTSSKMPVNGVVPTDDGKT